jgi:hypothetical protein
MDRGQRQEERFQDQLLIGARLDTIKNDGVLDKLKLAFEVDHSRENREHQHSLTLY